jgi:dipeptidyl aminopeptidase/acylaminoacyl peptidase
MHLLTPRPQSSPHLLRLAATGLILAGGLCIAAAHATPQLRTANDGQLVMQDVPPIPADLAESLRRFQNTRSAMLFDWTADGRGLYIATRFAATTQLHRVMQPGGAREQLTWFDDAVGSAVRQPGSEMLAFTMDAGGNEFSQIFFLDPSDGEARMVSDGESRNGALLWSHDGSQLAFASTRRDGRANDIWLMSPQQPEAARLLVAADDGTLWNAVDFSRDGRTLLVHRYVSINDSYAYLVDVASGERRRIAGSDTTLSRNIPTRFAADGESVFLLTDEGSEFARLSKLPLQKGSSPQIITADIDWTVTDFALNHDGTRAAFVTNEGGLSQLYLLDPRSLRYRRVETLPLGVASQLRYSPDGQRLALTLNTPRTPSDTFVLEPGRNALRPGALQRWTWSEVGGLDTAQFREPELVDFPSFDEVDGQPRRIPAFVYRPEGAGPHPVIIQIHGGPESQSRPVFNSTFQMWLRELGVAVISPNVRGSSGYGRSFLLLDNARLREDSVRDIGALLDWIQTQPDLDGDRVAVFGGSYGGYMVLASAVHYSDRLAAAVNMVGISNFVTFLENTESYRRDLRRVEYGDERDPEMRAFLQSISPLNHVDRIDVPMFVVHGQNDPRVPVSEAEQLVAALRERNLPVWYMNALNEGHGFRRKENQDIYQQAVVLFLRMHLLH